MRDEASKRNVTMRIRQPLPLSLPASLTGAHITMDDLLNYRVRTYPAVSMPLRSGHVIHTTGPPTSGAITAFMLRVLEGMQCYIVRLFMNASMQCIVWLNFFFKSKSSRYANDKKRSNLRTLFL